MRHLDEFFHFYDLRVYENYSQIFGRVLVNKAYKHSVETYALTATGTARDKTVRKLRQILIIAIAVYILTESKVQTALMVFEFVFYYKVFKTDRLSLLVGDFYTAEGLAGNRCFNSERSDSQRKQKVTFSLRYLFYGYGRRNFKLESRYGRSGDNVFDLYVYTEVCIGIFDNTRLFLYIFGISRAVVLIVLQVVYAGRDIRASDYRLIFFLLLLFFFLIKHRALFFGRQSS